MSVIDEIAAERKRQIEAESWDVAHDDAHTDGGLARAAAAYAFAGACQQKIQRERLSKAHLLELHGSDIGRVVKSLWRWDWCWWKPKDPRRDLIRAGALIVAEIERLDRATRSKGTDING